MIFIDRSIPKPVANALKQVRNDVSWLEDHFLHDQTDDSWLASVGAWGWLTVSRDKHILTRPGEIDAWMRNGVGGFIIGQKQDPTKWQYLQLLAKTLDEMEEVFAKTERPFLYNIAKNGALRRVK